MILYGMVNPSIWISGWKHVAKIDMFKESFWTGVIESLNWLHVKLPGSWSVLSEHSSQEFYSEKELLMTSCGVTYLDLGFSENSKSWQVLHVIACWWND